MDMMMTLCTGWQLSSRVSHYSDILRHYQILDSLIRVNGAHKTRFIATSGHLSLSPLVIILLSLNKYKLQMNLSVHY